jgi:hypothetical protein
MASTGKVRSPSENAKTQCTNRAEYRLLPGRPAGPIASYYQLPCDFGSSVIASWGSEEETEPLYLCEAHARDFQSSAVFCRSGASTARHKKEEKGAKPEARPGAKPELVPAVQETSLAPPALDTITRAPEPTTRAESVADRCAAIDRQIGDLASQMESILSESAATIDLSTTIDAPLEQAILEIIGNAAMSEAQKDATIARLGELQRSLKQRAGQRMPLLEAYQIKRDLAGCLSSNFAVSDDMKPGYRAVHDALEKAIHAALAARESRLSVSDDASNAP